MEFFKIRFGNDLDEITYRFEKTVEDMLGSRGPSFMLSERAWRPAMDMYEMSDTIVILAEIGGVQQSGSRNRDQHQGRTDPGPTAGAGVQPGPDLPPGRDPVWPF